MSIKNEVELLSKLRGKLSKEKLRNKQYLQQHQIVFDMKEI